MLSKKELQQIATMVAALVAVPTTRRVTRVAQAKAGKARRVKQGFVARLPEFAANREARRELFASRAEAGLPTSGAEWVEAKADAGICDKSTRDAGLN